MLKNFVQDVLKDIDEDEIIDNYKSNYTDNINAISIVYNNLWTDISKPNSLKRPDNLLKTNELHQLILKDDGTLEPAQFSGPGTQIFTRLKEMKEKKESFFDLPVTDQIALLHDVSYMLSNSKKDVTDADKIMVKALQKAEVNQTDSLFNTSQAKLPIQAKIIGDSYGVLPSFSDQKGNELPEDEKKLYNSIKNQLTFKKDDDLKTFEGLALNDKVERYFKEHNNGKLNEYDVFRFDNLSSSNKQKVYDYLNSI